MLFLQLQLEKDFLLFYRMDHIYSPLIKKQRSIMPRHRFLIERFLEADLSQSQSLNLLTFRDLLTFPVLQLLNSLR
ncbi:hypothetical protein ACVIJU_001807 [Aeribacillus sp. SP014]|jgi:hypothetical protein